jgi:hypothetical protein
MAGTYSKIKTVTTGDIISATDRNAEHDDHINHCDFSGLGDYSASTTEMRSTTDPYPGSVESLATDGKGELERLRYLIAQLAGKSEWYIDPSSSIETIVNGTQIFAGTKTFSTAITITPVTNQLILGTTRTVTLTAPTPASSSRTHTIPDVSADSSFIMAHGTQTVTGTKTFDSSTLRIQEAGSTDVVTIACAALAANRVYTLPEAGASASFVMTEGAATINGAITLGTALTGVAGSNTAPSYNVGTANTGMYRSAANTIGFTTNGTLRVTIDSNGDLNVVNSTVRVVGVNTASFADYARIDDPNTGLRLTGTDTLALTTGGTDALTISAAQVVAIGNGSAAVNIRLNSKTGGGALTGTLTNSPATGNPSVWLQVNINGTQREIPCW